MNGTHGSPTAQLALAVGLTLCSLFAGTAADAATAAEYEDSWREQAIALTAAHAREARLPAGRWEIRFDRKQPIDGTVAAQLYREGRTQARLSGRPRGCPPEGTAYTYKLQRAIVSSYSVSGAAQSRTFDLAAPGHPRCLLRFEAAGLDVVIAAATTDSSPPHATSDGGNPPVGSLDQRVAAVLAAAHQAQSAFPPAAEIPAELRPHVATTQRALVALTSTSAGNPRLVANRLEEVEKSIPKLQVAIADGSVFPTAVANRCLTAARQCRATCSGSLCICEPILAGCLGGGLRVEIRPER